MKKSRLLLIILLLSCLHTCSKVSAQSAPSTAQITINNFSGNYYLSRDSNGRSLLTTEEVILADFPANGNFAGISRSIPKSYEGRSVEVKVLGVKDAGGASVPYKTTTDKNGNLTITTGDPAINLYGLQTFRISYQTAGVIDIKPTQNTLLLVVNGRGWAQPIQQVSGVVHMPLSFASNLNSKPTCYIGYLSTVTYNCSTDSKTQNGEILVTSKSAGPLAAHQALIVKLNFKAATFTNKKNFNPAWLAIIGVLALAGGSISAWKHLSRR
jgi:hypothetical protein